MTLIKCKECGKEYSTDAKACPNCGKRRTTRTTYAVLGLVAIGVIYNAQRDNAETTRQAVLTPEARAAEVTAQAKAGILYSARSACKYALKESLNDPDSAQLTRTESWYIEERKDGSVRVQPQGRAKNAFGAYVYGVWDCVAKPVNGEARVVSLKQIQP